MLIRKGMSAQAAADAVHEAFIRLLKLPSRDIRDIKAYLHRITQNIAVDMKRRECRAALTIDPMAGLDENIADTQPLADAFLISKEEAMALEAALLQLPPRCREVLILHKFEGLTYLEIAERLGIAKNTVMVHMVKALGFLKCQLREGDKTLN